MSHRFEFPLDQIPHDGASTPVGFSSPFEDVEEAELFEAWCRERHESIELRLYVDEAHRLLKDILAEGSVTPESRKRAKLLMLAIRSVRRGERP